MGRAMLIICAGMLVVLGIIGISTADQGKSLTKKAVTYANETTAQNAAHTAIQVAMQRINEDDCWGQEHPKDSPWETTLADATISLSVETDYDCNNTDPDSKLDTDKLWITSHATYANDYKAKVVSVYEKQPFSNLVPEFKSALSIATEDFHFTKGGKAGSVEGSPQDLPEECKVTDEDGNLVGKPGIAVMDDSDSTTVSNQVEITDGDGNNVKGVSGDPAIEVDEDLSYSPVDEMIARLRKSGNVQSLDDEWDGNLGTKEKPGVFFVEDYVKLTGGQEDGYGILVVQGDGEMGYEGDLDIKGNFTFNGLVIFENAKAFDGGGTPTINGSVLVGKRPKEDPDHTDLIDINIHGNISIKYNCLAEKYAKIAAANAVQQNKYTRVVTYE